MNLEMLKKEMIVAMKNGDKERKDTISGIIAAVNKSTITNSGRVEVTDELVNTVLKKELKTVQEMIDTCPTDRIDLAAAYQKSKNYH